MPVWIRRLSVRSRSSSHCRRRWHRPWRRTVLHRFLVAFRPRVGAGRGHFLATCRMFDDEHEAFRESFAAFVEKEISTPTIREMGGRRDRTARAVHEEPAATGTVGISIPEAFGGGGSDSFRFNQIVAEELRVRRNGGAGLADVAQQHLADHLSSTCATTAEVLVTADSERRTRHRHRHDRTGNRSDLAGMAWTAVRDGDVSCSTAQTSSRTASTPTW